MKTKTALVTGGSKGIGRALSEMLIDQGMVVYSVSRSSDRSIDHENFHPIPLDLSDLGALQRFLTDFTAENQVPDLLVNNAGYGAFFEWAKFSDQDLLNQTQVLFTAPSLLCKAFAPLMAERKSGVIVNLSSLVVLFPLPYMPIYNAAKSALSSLTHSLMLEYDEFPRFIDFRLGDVRTSFNRSSLKQSSKDQSARMKSAWMQIERQLQDSPKPEVAAKKILKSINGGQKGVVYGGCFFQAKIAPLAERLLAKSLTRKVLRKRYFY